MGREPRDLQCWVVGSVGLPRSAGGLSRRLAEGDGCGLVAQEASCRNRGRGSAHLPCLRSFTLGGPQQSPGGSSLEAWWSLHWDGRSMEN